MKILGLDLGVGSVGWALIETDKEYNPVNILGMGSRIVSLTADETQNFSKGRGVTKCQQRTLARGARRRLDRYQMRRASLRSILKDYGLYDDSSELNSLSTLELWRLRANAADEGCKLSLHEIGRVLMHLNHRRGYRHSKNDVADSKQTDYVKTVNNRYKVISEQNQTIGQYIYARMSESSLTMPSGKNVAVYRVKNEVYPRQAYAEEFEKIMATQSRFHPDVLTEKRIAEIRNAIFFQRKLKSCKQLISLCEFEKRVFKNKEGKEVEVGPRVAPRTSPLSNVCRIYEAINNIRLVNHHNKANKKSIQPTLDLFDEVDTMPKDARKLQYEYNFTDEERLRIFEFLNTHEKMSYTDLLRILHLSKSDGFKSDKNLGKGLKGNTTYCALSSALDGHPDKEKLLRFDLELIDGMVDKETGEVSEIVSPGCTKEPLYQLWHTIYSIEDRDELKNVLESNFNITDPEILEKLYAINFKTAGFANKSVKFMRRILPHLMRGEKYSDACAKVGVRHSDSLSKSENDERKLADKIELIKNKSLRQPIVEKILNQTVHVVNSIIDEFGTIDEVRIELARSLKQSAEERADASVALGKRERENDHIASLISEFGLNPTRGRIQKYRMWTETGHTCMYCGQPVGAKEFLESHGAEVEHIIPRSLFFDDSFSNKTCACRNCNREKNNRTAYDFIKSQGEKALEDYITRVERLAEEKKISRTKRRRLLAAGNEIPSDFLERDLRQTQYISKKAREVISSAVRNVWASSGSVTDFFRHEWGYDEILHDINLPRYEEADLVEEVEIEHNGNIQKMRKISGWSKRMDHRHHAIDALVIALTRQSYVQRLNNLSSEHGNIYDELVMEDTDFKRNKSLLSLWASTRPRFDVATVKKVVESIAVSYKAGKKLATTGTRRYSSGRRSRIVQRDILIPRGPLHEATIYGKVKVHDGKKSINYALENIDLVTSPAIKKALRTVLEKAGGKIKSVPKDIINDGLTVHMHGKDITVTKVECFREEFVIRKKVDSIQYKDIPRIVDEAVRKAVEERYLDCEKKEKAFQQSIIERPLKIAGSPYEIKKVRLTTGLRPDSMVTVRKNSDAENIGYAKSGNNHHVAFYRDENKRIISIICTAWAGMLRKMSGLPVIMTDPAKCWDMVMTLPDEKRREELAVNMPLPSWTFIESYQMDEMCILGMTDEEFKDAVESGDQSMLGKHLYRVKNISDGDYVFRLHTCAIADNKALSKQLGDVLRVSSNKALMELNPKKMTVNYLGKIKV